MKFLTLQNIKKDFKLRDGSIQTILHDINLDIKEGECFTIIGPNGSGKSTLLRLIDLLEPCTEGKIFFKEKEILNLKKKEQIIIRRELCFVRQKPVVLNTSVYRNIAYGLKIRGLSKEEIDQKVNRIIDKIGLNGLKNKNARSLSGGEMQRVAIAMNFVLDSELYLLDEVSANLDPKNVILLESFINDLRKEKKTIIMSTHDRMEAIKYSDRIAVLNNGTITQIGSVNEVFTSPKDEYTALFIGYENIFKGIAKIDKVSELTKVKIDNIIINASIQAEGNVKICIHPESIGISKNIDSQTSYQNLIKGKIKKIRDLGNTCHIIVKCLSINFLVTITKLSMKNLDLKHESEVFIRFKATDIIIM
ncbi:MAG: ABC transporter ATP-binding protein [Candidatus Lokiarchaeota archaeon]|nr:ABC transporter ATP-binding protein [Candidatus Lokiarchaeota archaeon]